MILAAVCRQPDGVTALPSGSRMVSWSFTLSSDMASLKVIVTVESMPA